MKCLLLCAGYGTRFAADLESSPHHAHLRGIPKPLLPVGGRELLTHWMEIVLREDDGTGIPLFDSVCVVTNGLYHDQFKQWVQKHGYQGN